MKKRSRGSGTGYSRRGRGRGRGRGNYNNDGIFKERRSFYRGKKRGNWKSQKPNSSASRVGSKRRRTESGVVKSKKRQKIIHTTIPLSTIFLATHGDKDGKAPELIYGGFYECTREVKLGSKCHFLRINVSQQKDQKIDTVSIPVPFDSISAVSALSGMNIFEELIKAHSTRKTLHKSIERWENVIKKREEAHKNKIDELVLIPVIEGDPEQECEEEQQQNEGRGFGEESAEFETEDEEKHEGKVSEVEGEITHGDSSTEACKDNSTLTKHKSDLEEEKLAAAKSNQLKIRERNAVEVAVNKIAVSVEKAKNTLAKYQEKLSKIEKKFGSELDLFENTTESAVAQQAFLKMLQQEGTVSEEGLDKEGDPKLDIEDDEIEREQDVECQDESEADELQKEEDVGMVDVTRCPACDISGKKNKKFCGECGEKLVGVSRDEGEVKLKITKEPVWLILALKKPLEKFFVTDPQTSICKKDLIEKASLIVLGYNQKKKFSTKHIQAFNEVLHGPWKNICKNPDSQIPETMYSFKKTLRYLVKTQKRQETFDKTVEICQLCESSIKRMHMKHHMEEVCTMREKPCVYCETVFVMKAMEEHHDTECVKFPTACLQKCGIAKFPRSELEEHLKVCKNSLVHCEFESVGCGAQVKRRDVLQHMRDVAVDHVHLLKVRLNHFTDHLLSTDKSLVKVLRPPPPPGVVVPETMVSGE